MTQIEDSTNFFDEDGHVYSRNNSKTNKNLYFRCKYANGLRCMARVIVEGENIGNAKLTQPHNHSPSKERLCKSKVDKQMGKICNERKFVNAREAFRVVRETVTGDDVNHLPDPNSCNSFVRRRKRKHEQKTPDVVEPAKTANVVETVNVVQPADVVALHVNPADVVETVDVGKPTYSGKPISANEERQAIFDCWHILPIDDDSKWTRLAKYIENEAYVVVLVNSKCETDCNLDLIKTYFRKTITLKYGK